MKMFIFGPYRRVYSSISVDYICGLAGTGQPFVRYPQLEFAPSSLFALGSPIGVFLSIRGVQQMGENFKLPTCPRFFNIFHPVRSHSPWPACGCGCCWVVMNWFVGKLSWYSYVCVRFHVGGWGW